MSDKLIELCRSSLKSECSWVLFRNGTCVACEPGGNFMDRAVQKLKQSGSLLSSSQENINVERVQGGWMVCSFSEDICTFVADCEVDTSLPDTEIGKLGLAKCDDDSCDLIVMHVEPAGTDCSLAWQQFLSETSA